MVYRKVFYPSFPEFVSAPLSATAACAPRMPQALYSLSQYPLGQKAGESKGVLPLVPEVQEPGGSWRIFAYFLYARK